jgi:hypothetical protein
MDGNGKMLKWGKFGDRTQVWKMAIKNTKTTRKRGTGRKNGKGEGKGHFGMCRIRNPITEYPYVFPFFGDLFSLTLVVVFMASSFPPFSIAISICSVILSTPIDAVVADSSCCCCWPSSLLVVNWGPKDGGLWFVIGDNKMEWRMAMLKNWGESWSREEEGNWKKWRNVMAKVLA